MAEYAALRQEVIATVGIAADGRADKLSELLAQINFCLDQMACTSVETFQKSTLLDVSKPAVLDSLTSLYHHGYFWDRVIDEVSRAVRYERPLSVVVLDVDRFKEVNDSHGHLGGDSILRGLATVLKSRRRRSDVVARYGGDEFAMILPETTIAGAELLAERMRRAVEKRKFETDRGVLLTITFSAGCAALESGMSARDLVRQADRALYHAKRAGANQVSIIADVANLGV
ncbi:MAG TPA: GGDEF domain-containing protein [Chloroflexota bacterium]|nr:GGDEF domain-containing protein [Chloroflexota bacterium]